MGQTSSVAHEQCYFAFKVFSVGAFEADHAFAPLHLDLYHCLSINSVYFCVYSCTFTAVFLLHVLNVSVLTHTTRVFFPLWICLNSKWKISLFERTIGLHCSLLSTSVPAVAACHWCFLFLKLIAQWNNWTAHLPTLTLVISWCWRKRVDGW